MDQRNSLKDWEEFNEKSKPRNTFESVYVLYEGRELNLNAFKNGIFSIKATKEKWLKILTPKEVFQWLPIVLTKVNAGDTSENLLSDIRQIIYYLYISIYFFHIFFQCITI